MDTNEHEIAKGRAYFEKPSGGGQGPAGFLPHPPSGHIEKAGVALNELARFFETRVRRSDHEVEIILCQLKLHPLIARNLYGFHVYDLDEQSEYIDSLSSGRPLRYAIIVNQPIDLQLEIALTFLLQLVYRQRLKARTAQDKDLVHDLDWMGEIEDEQAKSDLGNRLRYGWRAAAETVAQKAEESSIRFKVRLQADPFPNHDELARRLPVFRRAYNEVPIVRNAINNAVAQLGAGDFRMSGSTEKIRLKLQRSIQASRLDLFAHQAFRDALVCGNGYLVFGAQERMTVHNLRPDEVEIVRDGYKVKVAGSTVAYETESVVHLRGIEQLGSEYGLSVLETAMPALHTREVFLESAQIAKRIQDDPTAPQIAKVKAQQHLAFTERGLRQSESRIQDIFWFPYHHLSSPSGSLYLPGQEEL